jgi:hypothetical protein
MLGYVLRLSEKDRQPCVLTVQLNEALALLVPSEALTVTA